MTAAVVNWALTQHEDMDLPTARKKLAQVRELSRQVIKIMTAEQALLAERLVRESGGRRGR